MEEKRETLRTRVLKAGSISFGGAAISCMVRNISATGVLLEVESPLGIPERFILLVPSDQLSRPCRTIWKSERPARSPVRTSARCKRSILRKGTVMSGLLPTMGALLLAGSLSATSAAYAGGGFASENPLATEHIEALPPEIQRKLSARARACGNKAAAAHYFSVTIGTKGQRFISLHFEDFACQNRTIVCAGDLCLHEVYLQTRTGHRLVFSAHARDLKMVNDDNTIGLEVTGGSLRGRYQWSGGRFIRATTWKD